MAVSDFVILEKLARLLAAGCLLSQTYPTVG